MMCVDGAEKGRARGVGQPRGLEQAGKDHPWGVSSHIMFQVWELSDTNI